MLDHQINRVLDLVALKVERRCAAHAGFRSVLDAMAASVSYNEYQLIPFCPPRPGVVRNEESIGIC